MAFAIVGAVAAIVGAVVAAYDTYESGQQQQAASEYNKKVARNQAQAARDAASIQEEAVRDRDRRLLARQRAEVGASGYTAEGSPLSVMLDSAQEAELEALRVRYGGAAQAAGAQSDAQLQSFYGKNASRAGTIGAGTTLLTGAAQAAGAYGRTRQQPSSSSGATISGV